MKFTTEGLEFAESVIRSIKSITHAFEKYVQKKKAINEKERIETKCNLKD